MKNLAHWLWAFAVVGCSASFLLAPASASLDFKRVHLVDKGPTNFLFRGNMPTNETGFAYDELIAFMKNRSDTEANGTVLPDNVRLAIISLNNDFDGKDFRLEREFWNQEAHQTLGNLTQWPIGVAGVLPPSAFPVQDRDWMANESNPEGVWCIDQVPSRVRILRRMLLTPSDPPVAIYVHCTAGCDRTGEMIGAYIVEHLSQNVTVMYAEDTKQCGRSPDYFSTAVSFCSFCM